MKDYLLVKEVENALIDAAASLQIITEQLHKCKSNWLVTFLGFEFFFSWKKKKYIAVYQSELSEVGVTLQSLANKTIIDILPEDEEYIHDTLKNYIILHGQFLEDGLLYTRFKSDTVQIFKTDIEEIADNILSLCEVLPDGDETLIKQRQNAYK